MFSLLKERNFLLFWLGQLVSVTGDHISLIAFPWLVLQLTGSAAMTGITFALQAVPRAIFLLYGGVLVDRFSPRAVMLVTHVVRLMLVGGLAGLLMAGYVDLWVVFLFATLFGLADAFFYPAEQAMIPSLVDEKQLNHGNALNQIVLQLGIIFGPLIAGFVIAGELSMHHFMGSTDMAASAGDFEASRPGLAKAFALDAVTFAVAALSLMFVRSRSLKEDDKGKPGAVLKEIGEALAFIKTIPAMALAFIGIALLEFFFQAPIFVGLPVLMDVRYGDAGASGFGLLVAAYGVGALGGGTFAGLMPSVKPASLVRVMFLCFGWSGATMGILVLSDALLWGLALFVTAGLTDGYVWVNFTTWLQKLTPSAMLGRVMSILILLSVGLLPVAYLAIGLLLELGVEAVLMAASTIIVVISVGSAIHPLGRDLGLSDRESEQVS